MAARSSARGCSVASSRTALRRVFSFLTVAITTVAYFQIRFIYRLCPFVLTNSCFFCPLLTAADDSELRRKITEEVQKGLEEERSKKQYEINQW